MKTKIKIVKIPSPEKINEAAKKAELKARHSDSVFDGFHYGVEWLLKELFIEDPDAKKV